MEYIVILGAVVSMIFGLGYAKGVIKGEVKPNKISWLMWSIAPLIAAIAAFSNGVRLSVLPVFMSGFVPLVIFVISLVNKKAYWKIS